ncbi:MAG: hypothetical protein WD423_05480 [Rhodothermales bacterium]
MRILAIFCLLLAGPSLAFAQAPVEPYWRVQETTTNTRTYFFYQLTPGAPTIHVEVLGSFQTPGLYEIEDGTGLSRLVALAGGPATASQLKETHTRYSLKVLRATPAGQLVVYEDSFERYLANVPAHPALLDGDIVLMEMTQRQRFGWRDVTSVVSMVGVLALAFGRLANL